MRTWSVAGPLPGSAPRGIVCWIWIPGASIIPHSSPGPGARGTGQSPAGSPRQSRRRGGCDDGRLRGRGRDREEQKRGKQGKPEARDRRKDEVLRDERSEENETEQPRWAPRVPGAARSTAIAATISHGVRRREASVRARYRADQRASYYSVPKRPWKSRQASSRSASAGFGLGASPDAGIQAYSAPATSKAGDRPRQRSLVVVSARIGRTSPRNGGEDRLRPPRAPPRQSSRRKECGDGADVGTNEKQDPRDKTQRRDRSGARRRIEEGGGKAEQQGRRERLGHHGAGGIPQAQGREEHGVENEPAARGQPPADESRRPRDGSPEDQRLEHDDPPRFRAGRRDRPDDLEEEDEERLGGVKKAHEGCRRKDPVSGPGPRQVGVAVGPADDGRTQRRPEIERTPSASRPP